MKLWLFEHDDKILLYVLGVLTMAVGVALRGGTLGNFLGILFSAVGLVLCLVMLTVLLSVKGELKN